MRRRITDYRISFIDFKNLADFLKEHFDFDLNVFAFTITKMRIDKFCINYNIKNFEELLKYLKKTTFFNILISFLLVETTELFRDPDFWVKLKRKYVVKYIGTSFKVWVPDVTSDDELISFLILLNELKMLETTKVLVTSFYNKSNPEILYKRAISEKKFNYSLSNYMKYNGESDLLEYFSQNNKSLIPKDFLFQNVTFKQFTMWKDSMPENEFDFVLFRNRMLYYSPIIVDQIYKTIYTSLKYKGLIAIGVKEKIQTLDNSINFVQSEKNCNIYFKK